jgi:hypothetical protein
MGMRERFETTGRISLIRDDMLENQLMGLRYFEVNGRTMIERKVDAKKRGLRSPDRADSVLYALAQPRRRAGGIDADYSNEQKPEHDQENEAQLTEEQEADRLHSLSKILPGFDLTLVREGKRRRRYHLDD